MVKAAGGNEGIANAGQNNSGPNESNNEGTAAGINNAAAGNADNDAPVIESASVVKNPDGPAPVFKAGDRVEVDPFSRRYGDKTWYKGVVVKVQSSAGGGLSGYVVRVKMADGHESEFGVGTSNNWIRKR